MGIWRALGSVSTDHALFVSSLIATGLIGVQLVLYIACCRILWQRKPRSRLSKFLLVYITILCAVDLLWATSVIYGIQLVYIDNQNFPGGPIAYLSGPFVSHPANGLNSASYVSSNILADALLVRRWLDTTTLNSDCAQLWRCQVIWSASMGKKAYFVLSLPLALWLAAFGEYFPFFAASLMS